MVLKKLNDKLFISTQLYNGPEGSDTRVFCTLKDKDGSTIVASFEIPHIVNGLYSEDTQLMPAQDVVFACLEFRESDGVTISCEHIYQTQRYDRDFTGELVASLRPINATIIGDVSEGNVVADIADIESIIADVEDSDIIGMTEDSDVIESIDDESIITGDIQ